MGSLLLILSGPAVADKDDSIVTEPLQKLTGKTLLGGERPASVTKNWFRENIRMVKKHGFEYTSSFSLKDPDKKIIFSIQGPMIRKKTPGLTFEIRY